MQTTQSTAIVTGAASGMGAALAVLLASRNASVTCVDRDPEGLAATVARVRSAGGSAESVLLDLADADAVRTFLADQRGPLDQLALCAGVYEPTPADGLDLVAYRRILDVNAGSAVQLIAGLAPRLAESTAPRVVTISSVHAFVGEAGSSAYAASKGALVAATKALAVELAPSGILVNSVAPGFIDTPMSIGADGVPEHETSRFRELYVDGGRLPLRRAGTADEVAEAAAFLLSPANGYITGHVLVIDGGLTATF